MHDNLTEELKDPEIIIPQEALDRMEQAVAESQENIKASTELFEAQEESSAPTMMMPAATAEAEAQPIQPEPTAPQTAPEAEEEQHPISTLFDALAAPGQGLNDYVIDELNKLPFLDLKKRPEYRNKVVQSAREISSFLIPTVLMTRAGVKGGTALKGKLPLPDKVANSQLLKLIGETSVAAGAGAWVTSTNKLSETDENLPGALKKMFPDSIGQYIPDDLATLDEDSPDTKRSKNVLSGTIFGVFTDLALGAGVFFRAQAKTGKLTKFIPKDRQAKALFDKINKGDGSVADTVLDAGAKRNEALQELGEYLNQFDIEDTPKLGRDDVFDLDESGIRDVDPGGVFGAAVDAARIQGNKGTVNGRLGSIVSDAALKYGLAPDSLQKREFITVLVDQIKKGGDFEFQGKGFTVTAAEREAAAEVLSEAMMDPRMDPGMLKKTLDNFRDNIQTLKGDIRPVSQVGYEAVFKSISKYMDEYMNMDTIKAQAYLTTSMAGQVADMAEGARMIDGMDGVSRVQEMILDRLEYLLVEKGIASYNRGAGLANLNLWDKFRKAKDPQKMLEISENARARTEDAIANLIPRAKTTVNELRTMAQERPEFLRPLQLVWEFTDGKVDTLDKLNNYVSNSLSKVSKAFMDNEPEIPNVIVRGAWANYYNSVLTTVSTPSKALMGNAAMQLAKPVTTFAGAIGRYALGERDASIATMKRAWFQYSAVLDTFQKGSKHLGQVFRKAATDPTSVSYIMRSDIVQQNEQQMDVLFSFAQAAEQKGNSGPMVLYEHAKALQDLANNPILRFGANAMSALDGFTRAVEGNIQARGRVWDKFIDGGVELNGKTYKQASDEIYESMFDSSGMIVDDAVDYASREIALNLDNRGAEALGAFIDMAPGIKPFLLFPKTSANVISIFDKYSPASLFQREYNKLAYRPLSEFTTDEIVGILRSKQLPVDENIEQTFNTLRAETLGRKAVGTVAIMLSTGLFMNDRIHGNGHYDKQRQKTRRELGWQPRSIKGEDGKWYSYDGLGPISDLLALSADVVDNFDLLEPVDQQTFMNRLGYIISANLVNKSMLAPLEPMFDVFSGNASSINRFAASFASGLGPLSGARAELSRIMSPQLREFEETFMEHLRNRNRFIDELNVPGGLPGRYDWIDGKPVGYAEDFMTRIWNATAPFKVADGITPEKQYLIDIEYDARPMFTSSEAGIKYTAAERSELLSLIGQQGNLKRDLQQIMRETPSEQWKKSYRTAQNRNPSETKPEEFGNLYNRVDRAIRNAKRVAEQTLSTKQEVDSKVYQRKINVQEQRMGNVPPFPLTNK